MSITYFVSSVSLWLPPLPRQQDYILEYILPTKSKRAQVLIIRSNFRFLSLQFRNFSINLELGFS
ncbi:MAG: hypothetical protein EWV79_09630 [Microcystis aeruginosa Ma_MB_S_20031200_S102D]|nr:MAG: hypothetical protein EWV79_09630 [Microcystis aeruginosa Ma_MB_S_20031200_S102D]